MSKQPPPGGDSRQRASDGGPEGTISPPAPEPPSDPRPRRFHGSVALDATRAGRDASRIADEVITHLAGLVGADVTVTLEIEARMPNGAPDHVVRTVTENSRTLRFSVHGFEEGVETAGVVLPGGSLRVVEQFRLQGCA